MNYKEVSDIFANGAFGMTQILAPYYKTKPADRDYFIWDSFAFMLAYFYAFDGIDQQEVIGLVNQFSKNYPDKKRQTLSQLWLLEATQFYGNYTWNIKTGKSQMPDVILYNLSHTSAEKKDEIPITEIDLLVMVELWTKIISYLTNRIIPQFNKFFNDDES